MRPILRAALALLCMLGVVASPATLPAASARPLNDAHALPAGTPTLPEAPLRSLTGDSLSPPGTAYVDGISDQSLPYWDGAFPSSRFASFFADTWAAHGLSPHIPLARYVVQWNVMSGAYPALSSAARSVVPRRAEPRPHARHLARRLRRGAAQLGLPNTGRRCERCWTGSPPRPTSRPGTSPTTRPGSPPTPPPSTRTSRNRSARLVAAR